MSANPIPEGVRAQAAAWFAEYDKRNHFPEMLALDAYAAGHAAAQQQGQAAPPSAPVGVDDALVAGAMVAAADACTHHVACNEAIAAAVEYALAQQPVADLDVQYADADALIAHLDGLYDDNGQGGDKWQPAQAAIAGILSWQATGSPVAAPVQQPAAVDGEGTDDGR